MPQDIATRVAAMTLFITDKEVTRDFYTRFFGAGPIHEDDASIVFRVGETLANFLLVQAVDELIAPAAMAPAGVRAVFTLPVADVDAAAAQVQAAGIVLLNGPMDRPWGIRTASVQDPDGHVWELAR